MTQVIQRVTLAPYHFVYYFRTSFCIHTWIGCVVCVLRLMIDFRQSHLTVNNLMQMVFPYISNRFLGVGWLGLRVNAYVVWLDSSTPFSLGWTILHSYQHMRCVCFSTTLQWRTLLNFWKFGVCYLQFGLYHFSFPGWEYTGCITTGGPFGGKSWF